jgi:hypothetical protein
MDASHIITGEKLRRLCKVKGLYPAKVKGTDIVQLSKGQNDKLEPISWDDFELTLKKRNLAVYSKLGWIKIMQAPSDK